MLKTRRSTNARGFGFGCVGGGGWAGFAVGGCFGCFGAVVFAGGREAVAETLRFEQELGLLLSERVELLHRLVEAG